MPIGIYVRTQKHKDAIKKAWKRLDVIENHSQSMIGKNVGKKQSSDAKKKNSESNKGKIPWNKGLTKETDERLRMIAETQIGKIYSLKVIDNMRCPHKRMSEEGIKNLSESKKGKKNGMYGKHFKHSEEVKEKIRKSRIKYLSTHNGYNHHQITKPEKIFANALIDDKINFLKQQPIGGFCVVDFYLSDFNLVIEIYGNYPHANPRIHKADKTIYQIKAEDVWKKDKERIKRIKKLGYKVLIFWEDEIYNDVKKCVNKIRRLLNESYN